MTHRKPWLVIPLLLVGLCVTVLGCSQSEGGAGARTSSKADTAPAPPMSAAGSSTQTPASSPVALTMETTGQVISVDPANRTLVVQSETGSILFEAQDRLSDQLQTLKPGDKVTVRYTQDAGKNRAEGIQKG